jgi:pSer/pThr/pTyr-binding forkhead associated (FHA) protein
MQVRLIVKTPQSRRVLTINRPVALVGRAKGCKVRIPEADVSRRHCRIVQMDGFVVIEDLHSFNGTFINGEQLTGARAIRPGDAVEVGPFRFIVGYELTPEAKERLESFDADVELLPEDSGPDFLEDVAGLEWVEEGPIDMTPDSSQMADVMDLDSENPTEYKKGKEKGKVLSDEDRWVYPTDLNLHDLVEPLDDDSQTRKFR